MKNSEREKPNEPDKKHLFLPKYIGIYLVKDDAVASAYPAIDKF